MATKLSKVKNPEDRKRFLHLWQVQSLSASDLEAAIKAKFGKFVRTGRKSKQPTSPKEALSQLHDRCSSWLKWYEQLANKAAGKVLPKNLPAPVPKRGRKVSLKQLPDEVQEQLIATMSEVKKLQEQTKRGE
jgi:hypothetical protein